MEASGEDHSKLLEEALARLERGETSLSRLDRELGNSNLAALVRRLYLERKLGVSLSAVASTILDFEEIVGRNIENPIGAVQVPLAVAGPLPVSYTHLTLPTKA